MIKRMVYFLCSVLLPGPDIIYLYLKESSLDELVSYAELSRYLLVTKQYCFGY
jgi:hypothetical protein